MQEVAAENIEEEEVLDVQAEQEAVESIEENNREPPPVEEMEEVNEEEVVIPEVNVSMMTSSSGHSPEERREQQATCGVPNFSHPIVALPSADAVKALVKSNIPRTYDLLAKYSNEEDLLNAIELMKEEFTNHEVVVPQLITNNMTEEIVEHQLLEITSAIGNSEQKIFYALVQKALLFLTYFLQWKYLSQKDYDLFLKLKGRVNGKRNFFSLQPHLINFKASRYQRIMRVGQKINYLCREYGMSSLSLLSVVSFRKLELCTKKEFLEMTQNEVVQLVSHRKVNDYLAQFENHLLDIPL